MHAIVRKSLPVLALLATACPGPREATDPRDILGDDLTYRGTDGVEGVDRGDGVEGEVDPGEAPATRAECQSAHEHLFELGYQLAIDQETDPAKKQELEAGRTAHFSSSEAKQVIDEGTKACLADGTIKREIDCIRRTRKIDDVDACVE